MSEGADETAGLPQTPRLRARLARDAVVIVELKRPDRLNALSMDLVDDLHALWDALAGRDVRGLLRQDRRVRGRPRRELAAAPRDRCLAGLRAAAHRRLIDAAEAARIGLVGSVADDPLAAALEIADEVLANSPMGVRLTKQVMWGQLEVGSLQAGMDLEKRTQILTSYTRDHREAVASFVERRPARFEDR